MSDKKIDAVRVSELKLDAKPSQRERGYRKGALHAIAILNDHFERAKWLNKKQMKFMATLQEVLMEYAYDEQRHDPLMHLALSETCKRVMIGGSDYFE